MRTQNYRELSGRVALLIAAVFTPAIAFAHPGHIIASGFMAGLQHPLTGVDHIAAMLAAGLWAAQLGNRSILALLFATVVGIVSGCAFGMSLEMLTLAEQITALSAVALGLLAAAAAKPRALVAATLIALFCFFHGYVHASETPNQFSQLEFTAGFIVSMLALQLLGAAIALSLSRRTNFVSSAGACCAIAGSVVLSFS